MDAPIFYQYNTPEEKAAMFERWIHLREEWEAEVRQAKMRKQMA